jgi:hypothetical protein
LDNHPNYGLPKKGDFQHFTVCGPFEPTLDDLLDPRGYHGIVHEASYLYGTVRDAAGNMYTLLRRLPSNIPSAITEKGDERKGPGRRLMVQTNRGDENLRLCVDLIKASGVSDDLRIDRGVDHVRFRSAENPRGKAWQIDFAERSLSWREDDVVRLEGNMIPLGLQWYLIDRDDSIMYCSRNFEVTGTVLGEKVQGFIFLDQCYMPEGGRLYAHRDSLMGQQIEVCWFSWGTRWDDGSVEVGHFIGGNDRAGFGMATDGKKLNLLTSNVTAEVTRDADGYWHDGIRIDADGEAWEIVPDPRGRQIDMIKLANPQQEGLVQRVGETRKPVAWFSWGETAPKHGNRGHNRYAI